MDICTHVFLMFFSNICNSHILKAELFFIYLFKEESSISILMARNHQFRVDLGYERMEFRSHLFETSTGGGFNSLNRRNHRDTYTSDDVVNTLSDQFSSMSLLRPKPRPIPSLPSSLQVLSLLCFSF